MIKKIDHIGVAVNNIDEAKKFFGEVIGLETEGIEEIREWKLKVAFIPIGETRIELMESKDPESLIFKFIEKRGEGLHHIALEVDRIEETLEKLKEKGIQLIDEKPRVFHGIKIAFLDPNSTCGVLLELFEKPDRFSVSGRNLPTHGVQT